MSNKFKSLITRFLGVLVLATITVIAIYLATSQASITSANQAEKQVNSSTQSQAITLLSEIGIAQRYDLHFDHLLGTLIGKGDDQRLYARFRKMFIRELGWTHFQDAYAVRLLADFSARELAELAKIAKLPVIQKLLASETKAYQDTAKKRFKMGYQLWDNYNQGKIKLPE